MPTPAPRKNKGRGLLDRQVFKQTMSTTVIHGESLGKRYRRGLHAEPGLRHAIENFIRSPLSVFRGNNQESFWALKDVSLEVREGEVVGLIGRNGAGKTTLLKILSRITRPTTGWAEIRGRVGSLLEVGTGFHPELTGRENTFLSGAILGMSKREIERKFDEIVAFAELEKFIDTQVKHYSSGMYVRLAFAVAAHLEPEILLVDEVLAVGDIRFQKKCLGKMGDVARAGRTVILVSHNLGAIGQLCPRTIWINDGSIVADGDSESIGTQYMNNVSKNSDQQAWERTGTGRLKITSLEILDADGNACAHVPMGHDVRIRASGTADRSGTDFNFSVQFITTTGTIAMWVYDQLKSFRVSSTREFSIEMRIPCLMLMPGSYILSPWLGCAGQETFDWVKNAALIDVIQSDRIPVTDTVHNNIGLVYAQSETQQLA
jgi:homopolymeric O-antigen transport system ATP-binding protein